jgi:hypothetical protein
VRAGCLLDLLGAGKLRRRVDKNVEDKLQQKKRLKDMLLADQISLKK